MSTNSTWKNYAKRCLDVGYAGYAKAARVTGVVDYAVPSFTGMHKTSSRTIRHYYESGIRSAVPIITAARLHGLPLENNRILDFGCGVGRQLLHFTRHLPGNDYYACDIDRFSIDFIQKNYPSVTSYVSSFSPSLEYDDNFFDMLYSVSIFSHLAEKDLLPWLTELARITRPGGLLMLTIEGPAALPKLEKDMGISQAELQATLERDGIVYKEYSYLKDRQQQLSQKCTDGLLVGIDDSYGNTVLSPAYVEQHWNTDATEVLGIASGVIDFRQDLVVLRRR